MNVIFSSTPGIVAVVVLGVCLLWGLGYWLIERLDRGARGSGDHTWPMFQNGAPHQSPKTNRSALERVEKAALTLSGLPALPALVDLSGRGRGNTPTARPRAEVPAPAGQPRRDWHAELTKLGTVVVDPVAADEWLTTRNLPGPQPSRPEVAGTAAAGEPAYPALITAISNHTALTGACWHHQAPGNRGNGWHTPPGMVSTITGPLPKWVRDYLNCPAQFLGALTAAEREAFEYEHGLAVTR